MLFNSAVRFYIESHWAIQQVKCNRDQRRVSMKGISSSDVMSIWGVRDIIFLLEREGNIWNE